VHKDPINPIINPKPVYRQPRDNIIRPAPSKRRNYESGIVFRHRPWGLEKAHKMSNGCRKAEVAYTSMISTFGNTPLSNIFRRFGKHCSWYTKGWWFRGFSEVLLKFCQWKAKTWLDEPKSGILGYRGRWRRWERDDQWSGGPEERWQYFWGSVFSAWEDGSVFGDKW
jgi:hypothetical protein